MDRSIGQTVAALAERDILRNTLIIFVSDNGAPCDELKYFGSNLPLRGMKNTPWEGGTRSTAFIWHPSLQPYVRHTLFHVTDWLPTIIGAVGGTIVNVTDGYNQWKAILKKEQLQRNDVLITIDDENGWAALREGDFKIIVGEVFENISNYFGMNYQAFRHKPPVYEKELLECETHHVLKETLQMNLNVEDALNKRNETNMMKYKSTAKTLEVCVPNKGKFNSIYEKFERSITC